MKKWLWLVLLTVCAPPVWSADLTVDDFAYGIKIDVPDAAAIVAMSLPEQVYARTYRTDWGDLRVFNANGEAVPHMIRYAQTQAAEAPWRALPFFPLPEAVNPEAGGYRVFVRTGPDGAVVRVDPQAVQMTSEPARTFLIDLSRWHGRLAQLRLEWQPGETNLMATLAVDASDDLVAWTSIQQRTVIADIQYGGRRLLGNTITLQPSGKRYLRLRQLDSGPAVPLFHIDGRVQPEGRTPIRVFLKIDGRPVPDSPGVFEYRSAVCLPGGSGRPPLRPGQQHGGCAVRIAQRSPSNLDPAIQGSVLPDRCGSLPDQRSPGRADLHGPHWRLTVDASDSTIGSAVPRLEIGYRPHDLFFVARGSGPFTLAYGSALAEPLEVNVAALFDGIGRQRENGLERWVMPPGPPIVLGGPQRLSPLPKPLPMRRIVLWSILVAGVLVVAVMAWRLAWRLKM